MVVLRHGSEKVVFDIPVYSLDAALLVALGRCSIFDVEGKAATKCRKGVVLFAIATPENSFHCRRSVVKNGGAR
jgi:hypothetical protein